jgi:hypothetical protein
MSRSNDNPVVNVELTALQREEKRCKANGATSVESWDGGIREDINQLEEGDIFIIPESYKIFEETLNGGGKTQYTILTTENGKVFRFFPSSLTKSVLVYEDTKEGQPLVATDERARANGDVVDLFKTEGSVNDGMKLLAGRKIKVDKVKMIPTRRFGTMSLRHTSVCTFNFAD